MRAPDGRVRLAYADFAGLLDGLSIESLVTKQIAAEELFRRLGITFAVYADGGSTERLIPFDSFRASSTAPNGSWSSAAAFSG
jgi:uncharacterized circularly permuted ATP-grasp superfamily protein